MRIVKLNAETKKDLLKNLLREVQVISVTMQRLYRK